MLSPDFTEDLLAFVTLSSMTNTCNYSKMPKFISRQQESKVGWDAQLGLLFFQFKLTKELLRRPCKQLRTPYFKIDIYPKNRFHQHNILCKWAHNFPFTFYCTLETTEYQQLDRWYHLRRILPHTALFKPLDIGAISGTGSHKIVYSPNTPHCAYFMSEPKSLERYSFEFIIRQPHIQNTALSSVIDILKEIVPNSIPTDNKLSFTSVREIVRKTLGLEMLAVEIKR